MTTYEPAAIARVVAELKASPMLPHDDFVFAGSAGDTKHQAEAKIRGTYHMSAEDCGAPSAYGHLYSLMRPEDIAGGKASPHLASALDIHWSPAGMVLVTNRLIASCKDPKDHRMDGVAEVAGTTNGRTVHAYYNNTKTDDPNNTGGWDSGHMSHNHISFKRNCCNDYLAIKGIIDVICGVPIEQDWLDMATLAEVKAEIVAPIIARINQLDTKIEYGDKTHPEGMQDVGKQLADIQAALDKLTPAK